MQKLSVIDQTAQCLREAIGTKQWTGELPGVAELVAELRVCGQTMQAALKVLEREGWIASHGEGKPCTGIRECNRAVSKSALLRVGVVTPSDPGLDSPGTERMISRTLSDLMKAGN